MRKLPLVPWALCSALLMVAVGACEVLDPDAPGNLVPKTVLENPDLPRFETASGVVLHATRIESAGECTVVVLHGGPGGDFRAYLPMAELRDTCDVILFDQRGAGLSERVPESLVDGDSYVQDLAELIEAWARGPVVLVGHSWGGAYAALFTTRHPDLVSALVLLEPGALTVEAARLANDGATALGDIGVHRYLDSAQVVSPRSPARQDWVFGVLLQNFPADEDFGQAESPADVPFWRHGLLANRAINRWQGNFGEPTFDLSEPLSSLDQPVLLVAGSESRRLGEALQREHHLPLFRNARLVVMEGVGHFLPVFRPEETNNIIRAFLVEHLR